MSKIKLPNVVIIGRPNVGKSALFNRLLGKRKAVVGATPGVTRDGVSSEIIWSGMNFMLHDTAGITFEDEHFQKKTIIHVKKAIEQADLLLFIVDMIINPLDEEVADMVRKSEKPAVLAMNKIDSNELIYEVTEAHRLGFEMPHPVSAISGLGVGDLLDAIIENLPENSGELPESLISIAVAGRPNVGKSTLVNRIIGDDKVIVDDTPGTTRDAIDLSFKYFGKHLTIIDTAGILRKQDGIDYYSSLRSKDAVGRSDVVLLLIDSKMGVGRVEKSIADLAIHKLKGLVVLINKWDVIEDKDNRTAKDYKDRLLHQAPFLKFCPILFVSALTGRNIQKVLERAVKVAEDRRIRISTSKLNQFMQRIHNRLPSTSKVLSSYMYATQVSVAPPHIVIFHKRPEKIQASWENHIRNELRKQFGFEGVPIKISLKSAR